MDWPAEGTRETVLVAEGQAEVTCMGADGNCLFRAVSHQLRAVGGVQDAAELRRRAAAYIRSNPYQFEAAVDAAAVDNPEEYAPYRGEGGRLADTPGAADRLASRLETDSEWAGEEALVALAAVYQARIEVYQEARPGDAPPCRRFDPPDVRPGPPLRIVYRLSRAGGGQRVHYDSVQSCTPAPADEEERRATSAPPKTGPQRDPAPKGCGRERGGSVAVVAEVAPDGASILTTQPLCPAPADGQPRMLAELLELLKLFATDLTRRPTSAQPGTGPKRDSAPAGGRPMRVFGRRRPGSQQRVRYERRPLTRRMPKELQKVVRALRRGPVSPERLTGALLLAMRRGNTKHLNELCLAADLAVGKPAVEDALDEAWRTACALNLPLSEDMKGCVVANLAELRYRLSPAEPTSDPPPAADAQVRWRELWARVDLLLKFSEHLELELEPLQSCKLAKLCVQNLYRVKSAFTSTYSDVPWEDMEYLLVVFIEKRADWSIVADVRLFREKVIQHVMKHRHDTDPEAAMRRLQKDPKGKERATLRSVNDLPVPRQHSAVLRDWHCRDPPPAADAHARWHELWRRVDLLREYSRCLQDELERFQGHDRAPGSADKSVMLARMCTLALHGVKGPFLSTYKHVPWEEMEYLLVMFIEANTVPVTLAHAVATARSTAAHLRCFRDRLEKYVLVHRAEPDPEAAMKRLKKEPREERAALLGGVVDSALTHLRKDFAQLRDWHSLNDINETLGVTCEALLSLEDDAWSDWGWLGLRWALFVVGERVKYSWLSPNLSPRWAALVEAMAPGGILKVMSTVRDDQEHGEDGSNAKPLALPKKTESERKELAEELQKLTRAARAALGAAEDKVEWTDDRDWEGGERMRAAKTDSEGRKDLIGEELLNILEPAKHKAEFSFEEISTLVHGRNQFPLEDVRLTVLSFLFAHDHIPEALPRVCRLLLYKSAEHTESFQAELHDVTPSVSSPLDTLGDALIAVAAAPKGELRDFAINGALRELASRWYERDQVVPTDLPFSPALFGRQLRNYLNHLDEVFFCSPLELNVLYNLLRVGNIPLEHGIRPRPRDPQRSRAENERLLRLVELKCDMFRCAKEGDLDELQRLVEDGADVSARDCQDRTLLHAAAQGGQVHVVRWLLGLGAEAVDPLAEDWGELTALHVAGTATVAEALLNANKNKTAYSDRQQGGTLTPLHYAAASGRAEVVAVLLSYPRDKDAVQHNGLTALHCAARRGHDQVVGLLLTAGARCQATADGRTPLVSAARSGSAPTVRLLLGAAPPPAAEDCWRAAGVAAGLAHEEACSELLDELEARGLLQWGPEARKLLYQAGCGGSSAVALRLLELLDLSTAALSESLDDTTGYTVLHAAASRGRAELVRALLDQGADPLGENAEGTTALDCAARGGSPDTIDALVERIPGGSLQAALTRAMCVAALHGQLGAAQRLDHHGADVNAVHGECVTPLLLATRGGHTEVVRWLLQRGADPRLGKPPPLHWAAFHGRLAVVKLLVPPLHAGNQDQDDPGGKEPSALRVAVQAGSREDLQRILGRFVEHLRPLSSRYRREDRLRDKAEERMAEWRKEREEQERLRPLQQVDSDGHTALHMAAAVSALPVVEYLLEREGELLRRVYSKHKNTGVPRLDGLTVYARDAEGDTALQYGAASLCAPSVAEALLKRMADKMWMALGHKDLQEVRVMAVEALKLAARQPGGGRLVHALCEWLLGEKDEERLQDTRRAAEAALGSGQHVWHAVVDLVRWHHEALPLNLVDLQLCAVLAMRRCLQLGPRGEKALQLLCLWVRDISGLSDGAADETHESVLGRITAAALIISLQRRDQDSFQAICRFP